MGGLWPWLVGGGLHGAGSLVWTTPRELVAAALVAGIAAWLVAVSGRRRPGTLGLRIAEALLWAVAVAVLVVAVAGPTWVEQEGRRVPGRLVVLVDGSASMSVQDGRVPRADAARALLADLVKGEVAVLGSDQKVAPDEATVDVYTFDEDVHAGPPAGYTGHGTDIGLALSWVADRYLGQELRGIVLITDGIDRGLLRRELREAAQSGPVDPGSVPALPGPLTVYQVGNALNPHDVAIEDVQSGGFAFLRTPFPLTAVVRGPAGAEIPVSLSREGSLVSRRTVVLDDAGRAEVEFKVTPVKVGRFAWELSVPLDADDAVPGNNTFPVVIRVVRDRTRVLQVCGSPSYDQKFLRLFLKEDPSVDLVSFFILRTHEDFGAGWNSNELSLIAFPYERLFAEDIVTFDLVVFQNFDYEPYFMFGADQLLRNVADYVRDGGALVMVGGDRSFDIAGYGETPLADVLPVQLGVTGAKVDEDPFLPALTAAGAAHPVSRLAGTVEETRLAWERLPDLDGLNITAGPVRDAAVLLQHPTLRTAGGQPVPVLAVREVGKGRTMALTVDASWRWSFSEAAQGRGNQAYLRLWKNAMRWLVADPEDRRVVVTPSRENVLLGDEVRLTVKVRDPSYAPVEGAWVQGGVTAPDGSVETFQVQTDAAGEAGVPLTPTLRGAHRVSVRAGESAGDAAETVFAVSARDPELVEIVPDVGFLATLAELYGDRGAWRPAGDSAGPLLDGEATRVVGDRRELALATVPLVAVLFAVLASLAWWVRRRAGAA